ncbi:MAG: TolC family protein [Myxococcales bacterium]|nr:TolC family protein [Myxococcales bacterium]
MRRTPPATASILLAVVATAAAQPAPPPPPAPPSRPTFVAAVDDPLLAPPAAAAVEVGSWAEAQRRLRDGPEHARAAAELARTRAGLRAARAARMPTAQATASLALDLVHPGTAPGVAPSADYTPTAPLASAAITASVPLLDVAARRERTAAAADQRGAEASRLDVERRTAQRAARAVVAVLAATRATELTRAGLRLALERAALGQRTFQLGAATELDALRTAQDVAVARASVIAGDEQLRFAREALGLALAVDGEVGLAPALTGDALLGDLARQCRPLATGEERADVASARADVEVARARQAQVEATALPTVELATNLSAYTTDPAPGRIPAWSLALVLRVPIWDGGRRAASAAQRAAAVADAAAVTDGVRRAAALEIARARRGGAVATALVAAAVEARDLAARVDAMTRRSFEIGRATSLELVQSATVLRQAELTLALREFERLAAEVDALLTEARCVP